MDFRIYVVDIKVHSKIVSAILLPKSAIDNKMYFSFHFRLDASLQQMLREMKALFGDDLWSNVIIGVSFWSFSDTVVQVTHI
jgi:hypothetical protein